MEKIMERWTPAMIASVDTRLYPHDTNRTGDLIRVLAWAANEYAYLRKTGFRPDTHVPYTLEQIDKAVQTAIRRYPGAGNTRTQVGRL